ncbi:MAG: 30S ribosomal protein S7 [Fibrobacteres bacterium]|jgi:small subunit ribosomal protein S7|nr:30S ribosomal protein S7 [Fibrobacterota bacterium]
MSRRKRADKRKIYGDPKFNSTLITQFMNVVVSKGKRSIAEDLVYSALVEFKKKIGGEDDELTLFKNALNNIKPSLEVKSRRVGGANYQVPVEVNPTRRTALALRWLKESAQGRNEKDMARRLSAELVQALNNEGNAVKKKQDIHRMAESNKAFAHFRW